MSNHIPLISNKWIKGRSLNLNLDLKAGLSLEESPKVPEWFFCTHFSSFCSPVAVTSNPFLSPFINCLILPSMAVSRFRAGPRFYCKSKNLTLFLSSPPSQTRNPSLCLSIPSILLHISTPLKQNPFQPFWYTFCPILFAPFLLFPCDYLKTQKSF